MKYLIGLLSCVFLFSMLAYAQETSTDDATNSMLTKGAPARSALSPNASVPNKISYQGLLTTTGGAPVADGTYELKFELFNVSGGGGALWTETQPGVNVYKGTFSVLLGSVAPLTGIFYQPLWVEVTANSGPGIAAPILFTPRTELASAAYSLGPWYSEAESIWVTDSKNVGINTTGPRFALDVHQVSAPTVAKFGSTDAIYLIRSNPHVGFNIYFDGGFRYGSTNQGGATIAYDQDVNNSFSFNTAPNGSADELATLSTRMTIREDGKVGIGTVAPDKLLEVAGPVHIEDTLFIGSPTQNGYLNSYLNGSVDPTVTVTNYSTFGGDISVQDELGNTFFHVRPSGYGQGGGFFVYNAGSLAFEAWGNAFGQGNGYAAVYGQNRSIVFDPRFTADLSVQLPDSSISSREILDEPGISNSQRIAFASISTVGTTVVADSVDITIPADGYIEVTGGAWLNINHTTGTTTEAWFGINETRASVGLYPGCAVVRVSSVAATCAGSDAFGYPCMTSRFYSVTAGTYRYYVNFYWQGGAAGSINAGYPYIRAKYYPTLYGTSTVMDPNAITTVSGPTDGSEQINVEQITITPEDHLNQLKAKAAQLKNEMDATIKQLDKSAGGPQNGGK